MAGGIVLAGCLSDVWSPRRVLMIGCAMTFVTGALLPALFVAGSPALVFVWLSLALIAMGFVYGPVGAWLPSLFPARVGYTGTSIAFNMGGVIGGGLTPLVATWLAGQGGLALVGLYLAGAGAISLIALLTRRTAAA